VRQKNAPLNRSRLRRPGLRFRPSAVAALASIVGTVRSTRQMTSDDYRSEAQKLRELARSVAVTREAKRYCVDLAAIFETLAKADDVIARSAQICGDLGSYRVRT